MMDTHTQGGCASMWMWTHCVGSLAVKQSLCIHCWDCSFSTVLVTKKHHGKSSFQPFTHRFLAQGFYSLIVERCAAVEVNWESQQPQLTCSHSSSWEKLKNCLCLSFQWLGNSFSELLSSQLDLVPQDVIFFFDGQMFILVSWDKCCPEVQNSFSELAVQCHIVKRGGLGESSGIHSVGRKRGSALFLGTALCRSPWQGLSSHLASLFLQLSWQIVLQNTNLVTSAEVDVGCCGMHSYRMGVRKNYSPFILSWLFPKQQRDWFIGRLQLDGSTLGTWKLLLAFAHVHIKVPKV